MKRWARILAIVVLILGILEVIWVIAAGRYLQSQNFQELLQKGGLRITYEKASSPLPGYIQVKGLRLETPETRLELPDARLQFSLLALAGKRVIFWSARGNGGNLAFEPKPKDSSGPSGANEQDSANGDDGWTVHFQKLNLSDLQNLRVGSSAAQGSIDFAAELHLEEQDEVRLESGRVRLRETQTLWKDQKLARIQSLQGRFELAPFRNEDDWLSKLSLDLKGEAELEEGRVLQDLVVDAPWLKIKGLNLKSSGRVLLEKGELMSGTDLQFQSERMQLELWKELVSGHGTLGLRVDKALHLDFAIPAFTVNHGDQDQVDVSGRDLSLKLLTEDRNLQSRDRAWQAALQLPESTIHDLRYFNHYLPQGLGFRFKSGEGRVSLKLDSTTKEGNFLRVKAPQALVSYEKQDFFGSIEQELKIATIDFAQEGFTVPSGTLAVNVRPGGKDAEAAPWAGQLSLSDGRIQLTPSRFEGLIRLKADDLRPLLWVFDPKSKLPDWSRKLFREDDLEAGFHLKADESTYAIDQFKAETADLKLEAWYQGNQDKRRGKLFIRYGQLSAGIGVHNNDYKFQLLSSREWFQNRQ